METISQKVFFLQFTDTSFNFFVSQITVQSIRKKSKRIETHCFLNSLKNIILSHNEMFQNIFTHLLLMTHFIIIFFFVESHFLGNKSFGVTLHALKCDKNSLERLFLLQEPFIRDIFLSFYSS